MTKKNELRVNKGKINLFAAIVLIVLLVTSAVILTLPVAAQEPELQPNEGMPLPPDMTLDDVDFVRTTFAYLSVRPNPVGVDQEVLVNVFLTPGTDRFKGFDNFVVTITKPDGTEEVRELVSYWADSSSWLTFTPVLPGEYQLEFEFPGTYFPAGTYSDPRAPGGIATRTWDEYYMPSSTPVTTLVVQEDPVPSWPETPLPTDYWTRPISPDYRDWWPIAGWYPWRGPGGGPEWDEFHPNSNPYWTARQEFYPWTLGPNSPHIVWKEWHELNAGLIGGDLRYWYVDPPRMGAFEVFDTQPMILYNGLGFRVIPRVVDGEPMDVWECFDVRTGEILWQRRDVADVQYLPPWGIKSVLNVPTLIEFDHGALAVPGVGERPSRPELLYLGGGQLVKYNLNTGSVTLNVSISPMTGSGGIYYMNGYVLGVQNLGTGVPIEDRYRLINWTTLGTTSNFEDRVVGNITWPWSGLGTSQDFNAGVAAWTTGGGRDHTRIRAACMMTGEELWDVTTEEQMYMSSCTIADHGKVAVLMSGGYYKAWDLRTGDVAWESEKMLYPWGQTSWASYGVASGYGMIYQQLNDGVYAFDWETGEIAWRYEDPAPYPYEHPFTGEDGGTVVPFYNFRPGIRIVDGKVYVTNARHSPEMPFQRGYGMHAVDAFTGEKIWRLGIRQGGFSAAGIGRPHDGYIGLLAADGYFYMIGKGPSATTVSTPDVGVTAGQTVLIKGTVTDQSPAQKGTPAVSDEIMAEWMEHLHYQKPKPAQVLGVDVTLTVRDPVGEYYITTATTDASGHFSHAWSPTRPGVYHVTAEFEGTESYGSSYATSTFVVDEAAVLPAPIDPTPPPVEPTPTPPPPVDEPTPTPPPDEVPPPDAPAPMNWYLIIAAAVVVAVVAATAVILKKRK